MHKYLAEFIATFTMMFCGTGAVVINNHSNGVITHVGIAITFGLVVMAMIYSLGNVSGSHMNPAVTIAFVLAGSFPGKQLLPYILSQLCGAFVASLLLSYLFPADETLGATLPAGSAIQSLIMEFLLSFFLMLVILNVAKNGREEGLFAGLAIGCTVLLEALFAGPISGASMNPARSIAPAIISGHTENLWIYIFGPLAGMAFAIPTFIILHPNKTNS